MRNFEFKAEMETAKQDAIGDLLTAIPENYAQYGPPPMLSYLLHVNNAFEIGYMRGYRAQLERPGP